MAIRSLSDQGRQIPATSPEGSAGRTRAWIAAFAIPAVVIPVWPAIAAPFLAGASLGTSAGAVLVLLLATCTWTDLSRRKIPNWSTYPGVFWALVIPLLARLDFSSLPAERLTLVDFNGALGGALACFFILLLVYSISGGGAGDVKLAAVIGGFLGYEKGLLAIAFTYIFASVVMVGLRIWARGPVEVVGAFLRRAGSALFPVWVSPPDRSQGAILRSSVPLAGFFALGALTVIDWDIYLW